MLNKDTFYNEDNKTNKNKLKEGWVRNNFSSDYLLIIDFKNKFDIKYHRFSQLLFNYFNDIKENLICEFCDKNLKRFLGFDIGYNNFCSKKCAQNYNIKYLQHRINEKRKINSIEKYGVEHTSMLLEVKEKQKQTNLEKYGVISPGCLKETQEKSNKTNLERYGKIWPAQNSTIMQKVMDSRIEKYNNHFKNLYPDLNILPIKKEREIIIKCDICNQDYQIGASLLNLRYKRYKTIPCLYCNPLSTYKYSGQNDINNYINLNGFETILGDREILNGKEIDIIIQSKNIGIEFNGLYWHSDLYKDKKYHLDKKETAIVNNINLIHIWEDDWDNKKDIVLSRINNLLEYNQVKIYARKCKIIEINYAEVSEFLFKNHLQGSISSSVNLGLFYNGKLVSVMTFGKYRRSLGKKHIENEWELYRFCSLLNYNIIGSFSKILNYFEINFNPNKLITYANYDWCQKKNNVYEKNGFDYKGLSDPNYWYFDKNNIRQHRFQFRKDKLIKEGFDTSKTEYDIMTDRGYYRIYDCGSLKYEKIYLKNNI